MLLSTNGGNYGTKILFSDKKPTDQEVRMTPL